MQNLNCFADFLLKSAYLGPFKMIWQLKIIIPFPMAKFHGNLTSGFDYELIHYMVLAGKQKKSGSSIFWSVKVIFKSRIFFGNEFFSKS